MSSDDEISTKQMRSAFIILGLFLASFYFSITEMRFWVSGVNMQVQIYETYNTTSSGRRSRPLIGARFVLIGKDGVAQQTALEFPDSWAPPEDGKLWVTYIPGSDPVKVRQRGERNFLWPLIFFAMIGVVAFKGWVIWQEASADTEKDRRSRGA
jgi:hypothetical protein